MDPLLGMAGACIPWQNKSDVAPLLINMEAEFVQQADIPGIRLFRAAGGKAPFDIFFCKTKWNVYKIMLGLDQEEVERRMAARCRLDNQTRSTEGAFRPDAAWPSDST
jgi:Lon-like ATP-dependent protease